MKDTFKKEYCEYCKKYTLPEKIKLEMGGYLHLCPDCGLSLSASISINKSIKEDWEKQFDKKFVSAIYYLDKNNHLPDTAIQEFKQFIQNLLDRQRKEIIEQQLNAFDDNGNPIKMKWT